MAKAVSGEVFLAEDTQLGRKVALKFLPELLEHDPQARDRFQREARSAAALDHPFICKIYEVAEADGRPCIAMEYVVGETLQVRVEREPLRLREVILIGTEVAEALEEAHKHQIVHRDLKPANIMLTEQGHVKVMDFGLAKQLRDGHSTGATPSDRITVTGAWVARGGAGDDGVGVRGGALAYRHGAVVGGGARGDRTGRTARPTGARAPESRPSGRMSDRMASGDRSVCGGRCRRAADAALRRRRLLADTARHLRRDLQIRERGLAAGDLPAVERCRLNGFAGLGRALSGDYGGGASLLDSSIQEAEAVGDRRLLGELLGYRARLGMYYGNSAVQLESALRAAEQLEASGLTSSGCRKP